MKTTSYLLLALALFALVLCKPVECDEVTSYTPPEDYYVDVSPECAALLLVGGGVAGGAAAVTVTNVLLPMWLCSGGFCAAGVQGGSLAAWWQSTMPVVASGSLFATLQSIAMGGVGVSTGSSVALGATLGAAGGATYLREFCQMVDQIEPGTATGGAIQANLKFFQGFYRATNVAAPYVTEAKNVASDAIIGTWNWFSAGIEEAILEARAAREQKAREEELLAETP